MERLTKLDGMGEYDIIRCFGCGPETAGNMNENCGMCENWHKVVQKLAAYEDIGLTPEQVIETECLEQLRTERDRWKARAEVLERAIKDPEINDFNSLWCTACGTCVNRNSQRDFEICGGTCGHNERKNWKFDEDYFSETDKGKRS